MRSLINSRFKYKGIVINGILILSEPRSIKGLEKQGLLCRCKCWCGKEFEEYFRHINTSNTLSCGCGRKRLKDERTKSLFEYWMSQWIPEEKDYYLLPIFSGSVGVEYIIDVSLVDKEVYDLYSNRMWVKTRTGYVQSNHTRGNCIRTNVAYTGCKGSPSILLHREVLGLKGSYSASGIMADHINHNTLDNRKINLRKATAKDNTANARTGGGKDSTYRGISYRPTKGLTKPWFGSIMKDYKRYAKAFKTEMEAVVWRDEQSLKLFGEFAILNIKHKH